jgi:predicted hotdog family 3-hydroxylacyl-ACP dehydratase
MPLIRLEEVLERAPHRPPMVWIDEIVSLEPPECVVVLREDAHYMSADGLRASSCIEFIAQSLGYTSLAKSSQPLKRAYLAALRDVRFAEPAVFRALRPGSRLHVHISSVRHFGDLCMLDGRVTHCETELCRAQLKVFSEY